jgi:predicted GH43/DUF377 family glycosyl hydrolase
MVPLAIIGSVEVEQGFLVVYDASRQHKDLHFLQAGAILFSKTDPGRILWRSDNPVWKS